MEQRLTREQTDEIKSLFEKKNQQNRLKKRANTQINKITNEREDLIPKITEIQWIARDYYK